MKLVTNAKVTVLAVEKKEASGDFGESFKMAIMQGAEVGTFSCTKDVYELALASVLMKEYNLSFQRSDYKDKITERIIGIAPTRN